MSDSQTQSIVLYDSTAPPADQREAFLDGKVPVSVTGLGKMGLPLAAVYADVTGNVTGVDIDDTVVERLSNGECHITGEPGLPELVSELAETGAFSATTDGETAAEQARVHVVIVPTLIDDDGHPELSAIEAAMATIGTGLSPGDIVIAESTLPPGTCAEQLVSILERESGLSLGEFGMAFCPERTSSGRALEDIRGAYPKIVGGLDAESTRVAELIYSEINDNEIITVSDATTAEAVKVFEGVYRDVNIGLANELALQTEALDVDVTEAIEAANTQPFCHIHDPGAGVGGHCIPYYPQFVMDVADGPTPIMRHSRATNESMPDYTAEHTLDGLRAEGVDPEAASVLVLGLTYRPGVDEIRATPSLPIIESLTQAGVAVSAVDPVNSHTDPFEEAGATLTSVDALDSGYDGVVLVTPQPSFEALSIPSFHRDSDDSRLVVVDGRNELKDLRTHDSIHYRGIGINV